jgi:hypothetical protein
LIHVGGVKEPSKSPTKIPELRENLPLPPGKGPHIK